MTPAKQMNSLPAAHPALNFLGGLTAGIALAAVQLESTGATTSG